MRLFVSGPLFSYLRGNIFWVNDLERGDRSKSEVIVGWNALGQRRRTMPGHGGYPRTFASTTSRKSYFVSFGVFAFLLMVNGRVRCGSTMGAVEGGRE